MFNGILKSDDVEVIETVGGGAYQYVQLSELCKSNIIVQAYGYVHLSLPNTAYIGKVIAITALYGVSGTSKSTAVQSVLIKHSESVIFTLKQGTVSFMYVGQQLNGLTATDKSKSGWIILGGVQGDTAITGYIGSVAIGSGAYCGGNNGISLGNGANSLNGVSIGYAAGTGSSGTAIGNGANAANGGISIGQGSVASITTYAVALGNSSSSLSSKITLKSNAVFSAAGDAQAGKFILMRQTTDATPLVMSATNAAASTTNILILPNNGTYAFKGIVVAKDATTLDSAMWEVTALMKRGANASTTALVGTPTITKVFNDAGAAAWTITLTADTTNGGGTITVTGEAGKTIRWVSNIDSAEVI